jgi:PAS domain-containing protein
VRPSRRKGFGGREEVASEQAILFVTDAAGAILEASARACAMVDVGPRFLVGKSLATFIGREDVPRYLRVLGERPAEAGVCPAVPRAGSKHELELRIRNRTGVVQTARVTMTTPSDRQRFYWRVRLAPKRSGVFESVDPDDFDVG